MALTLVACLAACAGSDGASSDVIQADTSTPSPDVNGPRDTNADADTAPADTGPPPETWTPTPGELGWPCETASDCNGGWCLESVDGKLCSRQCTTTCPAGWACRQNLDALPDLAFTCMPPAPNLCRPCRTNSDCAVGYDSEPHACIPRGDDGAFCGAACAADTDCPDGAFCAPVVDIAGNATRQCVPDDGECSCSPRAITEGAETTCQSGNASGRCQGTRRCEAAGLSECDAPEPSIDVCNGRDDNCDGQTDEAFASLPCTLDNEHGSCPGVSTCRDGEELCDGEPASAETCNGADDDCDGLTDEEGAAQCSTWFADVDGDGFGGDTSRCLCRADGAFSATRGGDCDDNRRRVHPEAPESCNGLDDDCDGFTDEEGATGCTTFYRDGDDDSFGDPTQSRCLCAPEAPFDTRDATDCDDTATGINPAVVETCNGRDDDCDGATDELGASGCTLRFADGDGDGHGRADDFRCLCAADDRYRATSAGDCNDLDGLVSPTATERCNGVDDDCDGLTDEQGATGCTTFLRDEDNDTWGLSADPRCLCAASAPYTATRGGDCNDRSAAARPDGVEICDGIDNDCDITVDEPNALGCTRYQQDRDLDGRGVAGASACLCQPSFPFTSATTDDCDDTNPFISPAAAERCNGLDDDCNGQTDEGVTGQCSPFYRDGDADGWGVDGDSRCLCAPDATYTATRVGDCDDTQIDVYPFADELCNGEDDDCDGDTDESGSLGCVTFYFDGDSDGFGLAADSRCLCAPAAPYAAVVPGDCDDTRSAVNPGGTESCNLRDDDCDGLTDEAGASGCQSWLRDGDGDGYGLAQDAACLCAASPPYRTQVGGDCDDTRADVRPGLAETCDGRDNDCNGVADDPGTTGCSSFYEDVDGDTWGAGQPICLCAASGLFSATRAGDCNDLAASANPGGSERCNQVDDDCDSQTDEEGALGCTTYLKDVDGDGFGVTGDGRCLCAPTALYRAFVGGDCDDNDSLRNPGRNEACNGFDDDCDGSTDPDGSDGCSLRYRDVDRDTYGGTEALRCLCTVAAPWDAVRGGDCNDGDTNIRPGATETCNGVDDDCDASVDEVGATGCTTYYLDADGDRAGVTGQSLCLCSAQGAYSATVGGDCDDGDARRTPGKTEVCNLIDDDCDLAIDEQGATGCQTYWLDVDDDTYGVDGSERCLCAPTGDYTATRAGDCDDQRSAINVAAVEVCDSRDNDCDGVVDESSCGLPTTGWPTFMRDARRTGHPFFIEGPTATDTAQRWKRQLQANVPFENSPIIDEDGNIVVLLGTTLYKLSPTNGNTIWTYTLPAAPFSRASPTVRVGGTLLVPSGNRVLAISSEGQLIWEAAFGGEPGAKVIGSPIIDQSGTIFVASNTHLRALSASGAVVFATAITASASKSSDPAIGPDGRLYLSGSERVYSFSKAGAINWTWCPLSGASCDASKAPGASVTVTEVGRVLAPMGNTVYLLADAQTTASLVSSLAFTNTGNNPARLWANVAVFSSGYTCCNPEEYALVTPAGPNGARMLTASLGADFSMGVEKRDQAHGAAIFDRDGDIFVGSNATTAGGKARFSARRNRAAGNNKGAEYWGADVDGAHIDGAAALGSVGAVRIVVFGDSNGTIYCYGK